MVEVGGGEQWVNGSFQSQINWHTHQKGASVTAWGSWDLHKLLMLFILPDLKKDIGVGSEKKHLHIAHYHQLHWCIEHNSLITWMSTTSNRNALGYLASMAYKEIVREPITRKPNDQDNVPTLATILSVRGVWQPQATTFLCLCSRFRSEILYTLWYTLWCGRNSFLNWAH